MPPPAALARGAVHQARLTLARRLERRPWLQQRLVARSLATADRWWERPDDPVADLHAAESSRWSQNGEDGLLAALIERVGEADRTFVEIGCADGRENCTRALAEEGWRGAWFDGDDERVADARREVAGLDVVVTHAVVTSGNVPDLLADAGVVPEPTVAVLDIDGSDLWVLRSMLRSVRPRIVVVEYNATFPPGVFWTRRNRSTYTWPETYEHGASLDAMAWAAGVAGYQLVACDSNGVNAFFVRQDLTAAAGLRPLPVADAYRPLLTLPPIIGHPWRRPEPCPVLPPGEARAVRIIDATLVFDRRGPAPQQPRVVGVRAVIDNPTATRLTSGGPTPVSLSARLLDRDGAPLAHECERNYLIGGIPARGSAPAAALFRIAEADVGGLRLALVQDGVAWLESATFDLPLAAPSVAVR
jgi:hypothetical protein